MKILTTGRAVVLAAVAATLALAGCAQEGPAERAGAAIDDAVDNVADAGNDIGNAIEDACEDVKRESGASDTDC